MLPLLLCLRSDLCPVQSFTRRWVMGERDDFPPLEETAKKGARNGRPFFCLGSLIVWISSCSTA